MIRTKKVYDAYYWLALTILFFAVIVCDVILLFCRSSNDRASFIAALVFGVVLFAVGPRVLKTTAGLFREYQLEPSGITEYSVFRRTRTIAWEDYPHAYIVRMSRLFRLPRSCTHFILLTKKPLPARMTKEKDKDPAHYYKNPGEYLIFGYSEELEQQIRELRPDVRFIRRDLNRY